MPTLADLKARCDVVVIGGGVHGAAAAREAARLGRDVLLVEQHDFCARTSANSLKIIHGGLRYLQTLNLTRSRESAREQGRLLQGAPHLVETLPCIMGTGHSITRGRAAMALGLWLYDHLIRAGLPRHPHGRLLGVAEANRLAGADLFRHCTGAALWYDARALDTERLVLTYLKTAEQDGARILNYVAATDVEDRQGAVCVGLRDVSSGETARIEAGVVIDTGSLLAPHRAWSRAVNLVLKRDALNCAVALRLADRSADSGRLFFAMPHHGALIIGTWYFPDRESAPDKLSDAELERCVADTRSMLPGLEISRDDVSMVHVGRLPVRDPGRPLSLLEQPVIHRVGGTARVLSVTGVKYTTAGPTAVRALRLAGLPAGRDRADTGAWYAASPSMKVVSEQVRGLLAAHLEGDASGRIIDRLCRQYGAAAVDIARRSLARPGGLERIPGCDAVDGEIEYCMEEEYCRTVGDFLLRRSGLGNLGEPPAGAAAHCAEVMGRWFGWSAARVEAELGALAAHYRLTAPDL
ncbi:MAG: FAD-dependent oxidoreductase [Gammaproteobacteria bacterium]|nr:FAD-dependent oxidoreductase [Gammaproteobacteria bacterium]